MSKKHQPKASNILVSAWHIEADWTHWPMSSINHYREYSPNSNKIYKTNHGEIVATLNIILVLLLVELSMINKSDFLYYQIHHIWRLLILLLWDMWRLFRIINKICPRLLVFWFMVMRLLLGKELFMNVYKWDTCHIISQTASST